MATLKSLLNAFSKASSQWSLPKGNQITIGTAQTHATSTESWDDQLQYTAPCDGVICCYNLNAEHSYIISTNTGTDTEGWGDNQRRLWAFIRKGRVAKCTSFNPTAVTTWYFMPLLGQV